MKRSEINRLIQEAITFFDMLQFKLPPFAYWTPQEWNEKGTEADEIRDCMLGWDITDFGLSDFNAAGLILFTLRNGKVNDPRYPKPYAEKLMIVNEQQITPTHFHWSKTFLAITLHSHPFSSRKFAIMALLQVIS